MKRFTFAAPNQMLAALKEGRACACMKKRSYPEEHATHIIIRQKLQSLPGLLFFLGQITWVSWFRAWRPEYDPHAADFWIVIQ